MKYSPRADLAVHSSGFGLIGFHYKNQTTVSSFYILTLQDENFENCSFVGRCFYFDITSNIILGLRILKDGIFDFAGRPADRLTGRPADRPTG